MKKIVVAAIVVMLIIAFSGCASVLKSMGGVSKTEVDARDAAFTAKIDSLTATLEKAKTQDDAQEQNILAAMKDIESARTELAALNADLGNVKLTVQEVEQAKAAIDALSARLEQITDQTLLKLASLIQQSLGSAPQASIQAPASAEAPAQ
jgi:DNA repair exonuclease SbcCD ATPase subunit